MLEMLEQKIEDDEMVQRLGEMSKVVDELTFEHQVVSTALERNKQAGKRRQQALFAMISLGAVGLVAIAYLVVLKLQSLEGWRV